MAITFKGEDRLEKMLENFATLPDSDKLEPSDSQGKDSKKTNPSKDEDAN